MQSLFISASVAPLPQKATTAENTHKSSSLQLPVAKPKIYSENSFIVDEQLAEDECLCEVCCDLMDTNEQELGLLDKANPVLIKPPCRHKVCARCWKLHLSAAYKESNQVILGSKVEERMHNAMKVG